MADAETRSRSEPLADWAVRRVRLDGKPFSFAGHEYLRVIYDDTSRHVVLLKAAQVGGTVWAILRAIHACMAGLNVMYLFPTRTDVIEFSKSRVKPLIEENAFLQKAIRDTDTAGLKRIGPAHLHLRGMQSPIGIKSVPADMVVFDELDEATPDARTRALERLSHSSYKRIVELSNPSLPDYGIDHSYEGTDQRHWMLKCPRCNEWTSMVREFPRKPNEEVWVIRIRPDETAYRACVKCGGELDPEVGEWVATFPERKTRGYILSQLYSPLVDPGEILTEYRRTRFPDRFYNLKIGIAWVDRENRLSPDEVIRLCGDEGHAARPEHDCVMGVDTGRELHVVVAEPELGSGPATIRFLGAMRTFEDLDWLMKEYKVRCCVIDGLPETHATRAFAGRHRRLVFLNYFSEHQRGATKWDVDTAMVTENRTEALDASRRAIRDERVVLPRRSRITEEFAQHLANDAKQLVEDEETGAQKYRYLKLGENHFSLAWTYCWLALEKVGPRRERIRTTTFENRRPSLAKRLETMQF
jgi:hypothetical protein